MIWHNSCVSAFKAQSFKGILTKNNIISKELMKVYRKQEYYGYELESEDIRYFLPTEHIKLLPIKVKEIKKFHNKSEVFSFITNLESIRIPAKKELSFRQLIDNIASFEHSEPLHWLVYKIIGVVAWCDRLCIRVASDAGFGKDSIINILDMLVDDCFNLYGATRAKMEYALKSKLIVLNELGGLKKEDAMYMSMFLLQSGDYSDLFYKSSRKTASTKEVYDISQTSIVILHNLKSYYEDKSLEPFEKSFTKAVTNRFPCLQVKGTLLTDFSNTPDTKKLVEENKDMLIKIISTLYYYKTHTVVIPQYTMPDTFWDLGKSDMRALRSFKIIAKYIGEYAKDEEEFKLLCNVIKDCYETYIDKQPEIQEVDMR